MLQHTLSASLLLSCVCATALAADVSVQSNGTSVVVRNGAVHINGQPVHTSNTPAQDDSMNKVTRAVSGFDSLVLLAPANVRYEVAPQSSVTLTGPASALAITVTEVQPAPDGFGATRALTITAKGAYGGQHPVEVVVAGPSPKLVYAGATGDIHVQGIRSPQLAVVLQGSGDITVQGQADNLRVELIGSGDMNLGELKAHNTQVKLQGSGDVVVQASKEVAVDLLGSGDVTVKGRPAGRRITQKGAGDVHFE